ncbi:hypothetical protein NEOLEDRAFT_1150203 [Neolentinus lepideus HHB14362 ss-1]|uniref:Uncharacterized protein n=1 Tax=Neolentinus lepideus HHB14362 ss-1 TaxID=1314782 RepID=A0A165QCD4_9AGAM|nr:hypothetical protein NEOLEDRAFT_1150203 [Neolentinus lepideus HHB14362 ss-1]
MSVETSQNIPERYYLWLTAVVDNTASRIIACVLINYTITLGICRSVQNLLNIVEVDSVVAVVGPVTFYYIPSIGKIALTCLMILEATKSLSQGSCSGPRESVRQGQGSESLEDSDYCVSKELVISVAVQLELVRFHTFSEDDRSLKLFKADSDIFGRTDKLLGADSPKLFVPV